LKLVLKWLLPRLVEGWGRSIGCGHEVQFGLKMLVKMGGEKQSLAIRLPF